MISSPKCAAKKKEFESGERWKFERKRRRESKLACSLAEKEGTKNRSKLQGKLRNILVVTLHVSTIDIDLIAVAFGLQSLGQHELTHPVDPLVFGSDGKMLNLAVRH